MNGILCRQLALDYCCTPAEVLDMQNHFSPFMPLEGRRRFQAGDDCMLKIAVVNGKLLFTGAPDIIDRCRAEYADTRSEWFFEAKSLRKLGDLLRECGLEIDFIHPFFIGENPSAVPPHSCQIRRYERDEIEQFRGDDRFDEAFAFRETAPDVLGAAALQDGVILGMAGASADSPLMQQIGINVSPPARGKGIGTLLVTLLKNEILRRGYLPYYGTSVSHLASQRLALSAGFLPAWVELFTAPAASAADPV